MPAVTQSSTSGQPTERGFRVTQLHHPNHRVRDLREAEAWFARVFGRASRSLSQLYRAHDVPRRGHPVDHFTYTSISDLLFGSIDPSRYVVHGTPRYPSSAEPHLDGLGWYLEDLDDVYSALRDLGVGLVDQFGEPAVGESPPTAGESGAPVFMTLADDAGLRYQFLPQTPVMLDHRRGMARATSGSGVSDPLGIECCLHHTVLTDRPERALKIVIDVLGGLVVHEGHNPVLGGASVFVHLADSIIEYAIPDEGTAAYSDWVAQAPRDTYHQITWKVADLDRVAEHLHQQGVMLRLRTDEVIVTDPATSLGVPWAFATDVAPFYRA